jgi:TRAP-type uncharacterized transport system substrate-binding protein
MKHTAIALFALVVALFATSSAKAITYESVTANPGTLGFVLDSLIVMQEHPNSNISPATQAALNDDYAILLAEGEAVTGVTSSPNAVVDALISLNAADYQDEPIYTFDAYTFVSSDFPTGKPFNDYWSLLDFLYL